MDFAPLSAAMNRGDWSSIRSTLEARTRSLVAAGAEMVLICTNTMHELADPIAAAAAPVPLIHIGQCSAEAVILGCTELPLIIAPDESPLPLIDTTRIHAAAAVDFAL